MQRWADGHHIDITLSQLEVKSVWPHWDALETHAEVEGGSGSNAQREQEREGQQ